jgi:hypothetical protein
MALVSQVPQKRSYDLVNQFDLNAIENRSEVSAVQRQGSFLTARLNASSVVYQGVQRVGSEFHIITVKRFRELDCYCLNFYVPKTSRNWSCYLYPSDFWNLSETLMQRVFPYQLWHHFALVQELNDSLSHSFLDFVKIFD